MLVRYTVTQYCLFLVLLMTCSCAPLVSGETTAVSAQNPSETRGPYEPPPARARGAPARTRGHRSSRNCPGNVPRAGSRCSPGSYGSCSAGSG